MMQPLLDDVWKRRGTSILWDGESLGQLGAAPHVISLRRFFELYNEGWPDKSLPLVNDAALIVAGLDVAIDALNPQDAIDWVEQEVYTKLYEFQNWSDGQLALIFWMADKERWIPNVSDNSFSWHLSGKFRGQKFPIGQCIWNGAQSGVRHIESSTGKWLGLYHHRIS